MIRLFYCGIKGWIQRRKRSQNNDDQLNTSMDIYMNLLIIQESSNTIPTSNSKTNNQKTNIKFYNRADPGNLTHSFMRTKIASQRPGYALSKIFEITTSNNSIRTKQNQNSCIIE